MRSKLALATTFLLLTAGCMSFGRGSDKDDEVREGKYQIFDLYLFPLVNVSASEDNRWELYPGAKVEAWGFSFENDVTTATIPGPTIRITEGDTVEINFIIRGAPMAHTLHWHGLHVPWDQDGVPYLSQAPIGSPAGGGDGSFTYTYTFTVNQSGTYWYHCHVDTQHHLDMGMYGAFIVDPADPDVDMPYDHESIMVVDEWDKSHIHSSIQPDNIAADSGDPEETVDALYGQLRDYYHQGPLQPDELYQLALNDPNLPEAFKDVVRQTPPPGVQAKRDWYPFTYAPYYATYDTFLLNGHAFPSTEPVFVDNGKTLRIRLINAGSMTHAIHIHGHHFLVTHKDGYKLPAPYYADTVGIVPGERYDLYVKLDNPGPWMIHDHFPQYEQNDHVNPGGIATHICYRDGWELAGICQAEHDMDGNVTNGDILFALGKFYEATQGATVDPEFGSGHVH